MKPLTSSEMAAWTNCPRGWYVSYFLQLRRTRDYADLPAVGTMVHSGLESYYDGVQDSEVIKAVRELAETMVVAYPDAEPRILKNVELATIMLTGYMQWVAEEGVDVGLRVIAPERIVEMPLSHPGLVLRGKIDAIMQRESDDAVLQLEHKTVGNFADIPKYAQAAPQFLTYDLLAYLLSIQPDGDWVRTDGVLLNMLRRVKRTASAKPPFYMRYEVRHNQDELRNHYRHVVAIGREIEAARTKLDAGWSHHDVVYPCVDRDHSWQCDCNELTPMFDDGSDVAGFVEEFYEHYDPADRYAEAKEEDAA